MSDTISEFTNFISNDPLMLALCIAIVVLIIVFILVLILGKKKDDAEEVSENTGALLQSDISAANLKSTQEFATVNETEPELSSTKKIPVVPPAEDITDKEAPISVDDALKLKEEREQTATQAIDVVPPAVETPTVSEAASAPIEADPFNLNNTPAPAEEAPLVEIPAAEAPAPAPEVVTPEVSAPVEAPAVVPPVVDPIAPAPLETPAPTEAEAAPVIPDGALPGIPDSTVNNSDDTNGMFGNLVESLNEENKEQVINTEAPSAEPNVFDTPAPTEAPAITTGSESSASVPLAGSPVAKEEKKVKFEPGAAAPEVITGNEYSSNAPTTSEVEPDDIELPMFSAPAKDDKLDNISGESFKI